MKLLQILKNQFLTTKEDQGDLNGTPNEVQAKNVITKEFTKDEDTFMFI